MLDRKSREIRHHRLIDKLPIDYTENTSTDTNSY